MTNKPRVYLAGSLGGRVAAEVITERQEAVKYCRRSSLVAVDPARGERKYWGKTISLRMPRNRMKQFVAVDESKIAKCQYLLVLTGDITSSGTSWEMGYAFYSLNIPVVVISPKRVDGQMDFTTIKASYIADNIMAATAWIQKDWEAKQQYGRLLLQADAQIMCDGRPLCHITTARA